MTTRLTDPAAPDRSRWAWVWSPRGTLALLVVWAGFHVSAPAGSLLVAHGGRRARSRARAEPPVGIPGAPAAPLQLARLARLPAGGTRPPRAHPPEVRAPGPRLLARLPDRAAHPARPAARHHRRLLVPPDRPDQLDDPRIADSQRHGARGVRGRRPTPSSGSSEAPSTGAYAALGLVLGLGLLSKFTYVVFLAGLGLAALTVDRYRARLAHPGILVAGAVTAALVLPFALWFVGERHDLARLYASEVRIEDGDAGSSRRARASPTSPASPLTTWRRSARCWPCASPLVYRRLPAGRRGPTRRSAPRLAPRLGPRTPRRRRPGREPRLPQVPLAHPGVLPGASLRPLAPRAPRRTEWPPGSSV